MSFKITNQDGIIYLDRTDVDGETTTMVFFDYELSDLFDAVSEFKGKNNKKCRKCGISWSHYSVFPSSCVDPELHDFVEAGF